MLIDPHEDMSLFQYADMENEEVTLISVFFFALFVKFPEFTKLSKIAKNPDGLSSRGEENEWMLCCSL